MHAAAAIFFKLFLTERGKLKKCKKYKCFRFLPNTTKKRKQVEYGRIQCCESGSTGSTCFWPPGTGSIIQRLQIRVLLSLSKNSKKLDFYCFVTSFYFLSGSGSIIQRHGSADPDPHQNETWIRNTGRIKYIK
jgi:hypothetical protein